MNQKTAVITGANRGIGLSLAQQYLKRDYKVFAVCRNASSELQSSGAEIVDDIDVAMPQSVNKLRQRLATEQIDLLINNAGILKNENLGELDFASIQQQFEVNALGPLRITEALLPQLVDGGKIVMMTSRMGSIADNSSGGRYGYRMSKAALNIAAVSLAKDLAERDITVAILHPGLVGTAMIGGHGDITPDEAAERLATRIDEWDRHSSGEFRHANGESLPW